MRRFCAADGCPCFDVLAYPSSTTLTSVHRHSKYTRTFSHRWFVFCALCPPTISKDSASAEGASEEKLAVLRKYCAKFILKCGSRVHYSQILGSIPNSLFWHLHCTNPCTKFRPCALPSLVFCFLFFLFLQSKCVVVKFNRV